MDITEETRYAWSNDEENVVDKLLKRTSKKCSLAPHGAVLEGKHIFYRGNDGGVKYSDFVNYINKRGVSTRYEPHIKYIKDSKSLFNTWANRTCTLSFLFPHYEMEGSSWMKVKKRDGSLERQRISSLINHYEMYRKSEIPSDCRWVYCFTNTQGNCGIIADEWLYRIGHGKHILDSAPHERDITRRVNSKVFKYKAVDSKNTVSDKIVKNEAEYKDLLNELFLQNGSFYQDYRWKRDSLSNKKESSHAFSFIYRETLGYFMDANSGCVICYTKNGLISVCSRFLNLSIRGDYDKLFSLRIRKSKFDIN